MSRLGQVPRDGDTKIFEGGHLHQGGFVDTLMVGGFLFLEMTNIFVFFVFSFRCLDATQFEVRGTSDCIEMKSSPENMFVITDIISNHPDDSHI